MNKLFFFVFTIASPLFNYSQNVGVGTITPLMKLHVAKADSAVLLLENTQTLDNNVETFINFKTGNGTFPYTARIGSIGTGLDMSGFPTARLSFFTFTNASPDQLLERMTILDNGDVGIGVPNPSHRLHVAGDARINGIISGVSDPVANQDVATKAYVDVSSGFKVYDGNNVKVGDLINLGNNNRNFTIITSTGHVMTFKFDGTMPNAQIYYSNANCTGTTILNSGGSTTDVIWAKTVVYSGSLSSLMIANVFNATGAVPVTPMNALAIDNPTCMTSSGSQSGWVIVPTTPAAVGLPAYPLVTPIQIKK